MIYITNWNSHYAFMGQLRKLVASMVEERKSRNQCKDDSGIQDSAHPSQDCARNHRGEPWPPHARATFMFVLSRAPLVAIGQAPILKILLAQKFIFEVSQFLSKTWHNSEAGQDMKMCHFVLLNYYWKSHTQNKSLKQSTFNEILYYS